MSIYTRTGDKGETSLFGGKRVLKSDPQVDLYGSIDELNSYVGLVAGQTTDATTKQFLFTIQGDLLTIGSVLAGWGGNLDALVGRVDEMEKHIDDMEKTLPPLQNFILPGGSLGGSLAHVARGVARRVERQLVSYAQKSEVDERIIKYVNRLSDLFFMLARFINKNDGVTETIWSGIPRNKSSK